MIDQRYTHETTLLIYLIFWIWDLSTSIIINTYLPITFEPHVSLAVLWFYFIVLIMRVNGHWPMFLVCSTKGHQSFKNHHFGGFPGVFLVEARGIPCRVLWKYFYWFDEEWGEACSYEGREGVMSSCDEPSPQVFLNGNVFLVWAWSHVVMWLLVHVGHGLAYCAKSMFITNAMHWLAWHKVDNFKNYPYPCGGIESPHHGARSSRRFCWG